MTDKNKNKESQEFNGQLSGSMKGLKSGTYMTELQEQRSAEDKEKKKFKEHLEMMELMELFASIDQDLGDLGEAVKNFNEAVDQAIKMKRAYDAGDVSTMCILLAQETGEDWSNRSLDDINDAAINYILDKTEDAIDYQQQIKDIVDRCDKKLAQLPAGQDAKRQEIIQKRDDQLAKMKDKAQDLGELKDFYEAQNKMELGQNKSIHSNEENHRNDQIASFKSDTEPSNPFAEFKREPISAASNVTDDPFATESITDPFNQAALETGIAKNEELALESGKTLKAEEITLNTGTKFEIP